MGAGPSCGNGGASGAPGRAQGPRVPSHGRTVVGRGGGGPLGGGWSGVDAARQAAPGVAVVATGN